VCSLLNVVRIGKDFGCIQLHGREDQCPVNRSEDDGIRFLIPIVCDRPGTHTFLAVCSILLSAGLETQHYSVESHLTLGHYGMRLDLKKCNRFKVDKQSDKKQTMTKEAGQK